MDRRKKLLVNQYEVATDQALLRAVAKASKQKSTVNRKVRIADALEIANSGISNEEYSYALKAHFDFLVTDSDFISQFAVEFDEEHHYHDEKAIHRDRLKNTICDKLGMPLLRVDRAYLKRVERFATVLDWIIEMWYMEKAWYEAYENGDLPHDADFYPFNIMEWGYVDDGKFIPIDTASTSIDEIQELISNKFHVTWRSYDPFTIYTNTVWKYSSLGICLDHYPNWIGDIDWDSGYIDTLAYVELPQNQYVFGRIRCRVSNFITGGIEVARKLAVVDCVHKLIMHKKGHNVAISMSELNTLKKEVEAKKNA